MNVLKIVKSSPAFVFPALINLISLVAFTRLLTLEEYGQLSLAMISIEFLQGIFYMWVNMCVMRFYDSQNKSLSIAAGLHYNLGLTLFLLLVIGILYAFPVFAGGLNPKYLSLIILGVIGRGLANFIQDCFRIYKENLKTYTIVTVIANASYFIPAIVVLLFNRSLSTNQILSILVAGVFTFLLVFFLLYARKVMGQVRSLRQKQIYLDYLKYGTPLIVSFISLSMFVRIDRYIIEYNIGLEVLGMYSAAFSLSNLMISSFFLALTLPTYPEIIRKFNDGDEQGAKAIYNNNGKLIIYISVPLVILSFFLNEWLCQLFFGAEKGAKVALLFPWVVVATFLYNYKVHYFDQIFQFYKKTNISMFLGILIGIGHLAAAFFFSKIWGAKGVSYSGILLNGLAIVFILYYSQYVISFQPKKALSLNS
jgi:O-antigen/teichoic acid export membrane protein